MKAIMQKYKNFHDAAVESCFYNINNKQAEIVLDALNFFEQSTKREKVKLTCINVININIKEMFPWDFILEAILEKSNDGKLITFKTDKDNPFLSIVCENMIIEII